MKLIVVAAGQGTRLRPLTDNIPKCMVPFRGKAIIDHIIDTARTCGVQEIGVVHGYRADVLEAHLKDREVQFFHNPRYDQTNMVSSLFCARSFLQGDVIISYGDIVYEPAILKALMDDVSPLAMTIDLAWQKLWSLRMEDPLADAETLKMNPTGEILELGKKPQTLDDIQGQYMGLILWRAAAMKQILDFYDNLDTSAMYDGKNFDNMYMTSFLQQIIDGLMPAKAVPVQGGWLEIDSTDDLEAYNKAELRLNL